MSAAGARCSPCISAQAARAAASIFESGRVPDAAGVDLLARRAPGAAPVAGGGLAVYDGLAAGR